MFSKIVVCNFLCGRCARKQYLSNVAKLSNFTLQGNDNFAKLRNNVVITPIQRIILTIGSSIVSAWNPRRVDMLACCTENLCTSSLKRIFDTMNADIVGKQILMDKPKFETTVNIEELLKLPGNTFGNAYASFIRNHSIESQDKIPVRYIDDPDLAYVMNRCRQIHDYLHVLLNIPTNKLGEILIKWVEAVNIGLPTCYLAAIIGGAYVPEKDRLNYVKKYLPLAVSNGKISKTKFYLIYWEKMWELDLNMFRRELGVVPFAK